jgi:signal transduction histidine kinase
MEMAQKDITQSLIPLQEVLSILLHVFSDSLILNSHFEVWGIGEEVAHDLGYSRAELRCQHISMLAHGLDTTLANHLANGFFPEQQVQLFTKQGEKLLVGLSGFQSGLFSDINGLIFLRFRNLEGLKSVYKKLDAKADELDQFIYQAAHDLRGPLATIKGLVNIIQAARNVDEEAYIVVQLERATKLLDEKLQKLAFLAESGKETPSLLGQLDMVFIESKLKELIRHHSYDIKFSVECRATDHYKTNDLLLYSLLTNLFSFLVSHPAEPGSRLRLQILIDSFTSEILIQAHGFSLGEEARRILFDEINGYAELLKNPDLIYYYAAHKIVIKVRGSLNLKFLSSRAHEIVVSFPHQG